MGAGAHALTVLLSLALEAECRAELGAAVVPIELNMVPPTGSYPVNQTDDFTEFSMKVRTCAFEDQLFDFSLEAPECEDLRWWSRRTASAAPNSPSEPAMASQDLAFLPADLPLEQCATLAVA